MKIFFDFAIILQYYCSRHIDCRSILCGRASWYRNALVAPCLSMVRWNHIQLLLADIYIQLLFTHVHIQLHLAHIHIQLNLAHIHIQLSLAHIHIQLLLAHIHIAFSSHSYPVAFRPHLYPVAFRPHSYPVRFCPRSYWLLSVFWLRLISSASVGPRKKLLWNIWCGRNPGRFAPDKTLRRYIASREISHIFADDPKWTVMAVSRQPPYSINAVTEKNREI